MPVLSTIGAMSAQGFGANVGGLTGILLSDIATFTIINGQKSLKEITISDYIESGDTLTIDSDVWVWSDNTSNPAMKLDIPCTIINLGKVIGKGGDGGSNAGGPAVSITSADVEIENGSGAYIAGGGGGGASYYATNGDRSSSGQGGGGAGGGAGGAHIFFNPGANLTVVANGGAGGALNASGSNADTYRTFLPNGNTQSDIATNGKGGGAGGGAGYGGGNATSTGSGGGGGGRILPGSGGAGGASGGSAGNAGGNGGTTQGGGGGGWGASGGSSGLSAGGAGGKAIEDNSNSYTLTNNGTIYGATT